MDRCDSGCRSKRKKKRSRKVDGSDIVLSPSRSFIVTERPTSVKPDPSHRDVHLESRVIPHLSTKGHRGQRPDARHEARLLDPLRQRSNTRLRTPVKREKESTSPTQTREKRRRGEFCLPELVHPNNHKVYVDTTSTWNHDGFQFEPQYIRQTRSGISYQVVLKPPRRLPRIVSEGRYSSMGCNQAQNGVATPLPTLSQELGFKMIPKCYSGETFAKSLRYAAELGRLKREEKHREKSRQTLQMQDDRSSRMSDNYDNTAARVRDIRAKQDAIREHDKMKQMENFMRQKRKH